MQLESSLRGSVWPRVLVLLLLTGSILSPASLAASGSVIDILQPDEESQPSPLVVAKSSVAQDGTAQSVTAGDYRNPALDLAFSYPADWTLENRELSTAAAEDQAFHQVLLTAASGEVTVLSSFPPSKSLSSWLGFVYRNAIDAGQLDLLEARGTLGDRDAYIWRTPESAHDRATLTLVFEGRRFLHQLSFQASPQAVDGVAEILESLAGEKAAATRLPLDISALGNSWTEATSCTACQEQDTYANPYSCSVCTNSGNCTWKSEQQRSGDNNFVFGGSSRDAYKWMTLARQYTSYAQGGTMPATGAVLVAISDYGGVGHVGTVTSIGSDGSVTLREQNCNITCTRTKTYAPSWLLRYLAGYIYTGSSAPTPSSKTIATTGSTTIEDYGFSSTYYFSTFGPGSAMSFNGGQRAWGTSTSGSGGSMHYVLSKTGTSENYGRWRAYLQTTGLYEVQAFIPDSSKSAATSIKYEVGGLASTAVNQSLNRGRWVKLVNPARSDGYWNAGSTGSYSVILRDNANATANQSIAFDAIKWTKR